MCQTRNLNFSKWCEKVQTLRGERSLENDSSKQKILSQALEMLSSAQASGKRQFVFCENALTFVGFHLMLQLQIDMTEAEDCQEAFSVCRKREALHSFSLSLQYVQI